MYQDKKIYTDNNIKDLFCIIEKIYTITIGHSSYMNKMTTTPSLWYRGQSNSEWEVVPSIQRNGNLSHEQVLCHSFYHGANQIMTQSIPKNSYDLWLSLMQHYGLPTRLLDWSYSPLVALFFALDSKDNYSQFDACITIIVPEFLNMNQGFDPYIYPIDSSNAIKLLKPAFLKSTQTDKILACYSTSNDIRLYAQRAAFTIHDSSKKLFDSCDDKTIYKIIIPSNKKEYFKRILDLMDYNECFIFPDLPHIAARAQRRHLSHLKY